MTEEIKEESSPAPEIERLRQMYGEAKSIYKKPYETVDEDFPIVIRSQEEEKLLIAHYTRVIAECDILILSGIRDVELYTLKGRALKHLFFLDRTDIETGESAVSEYLTAIVLSMPEETRKLWGKLADFRRYFRDPKLGILFYTPLANLEINRAEYIGKLGYMLFRQGNHDLSKKYLEKAEAMAPQSGEYDNTLASIYEETKDYDRAEEHLIKSIKCQPEKEYGYRELAEFYERRAYDIIRKEGHFEYFSKEIQKRYTDLFREAITLMEISFEKCPIVVGSKSLILKKLENFYVAIKDYDMAKKTNARWYEHMEKEKEELWNPDRTRKAGLKNHKEKGGSSTKANELG